MKGVPLCIHVNEVAIIIRKGPRSAERLMRGMRIFYSKKKNGLITIRQFCEHEDLDYEEVILHYYTPEFDYRLWSVGKKGS